MLMHRAHVLLQVLDALTALDIATARGRHAAWMSGTRPCFLSARQAGDFGCTWIHAACHPLLLQRVLPPLPAIPTDDEVKSEQPAASSREARGAWQLQPVDLLVPPNVRVAAVTGPNTGTLAHRLLASPEPLSISGAACVVADVTTRQCRHG